MPYIVQTWTDYDDSAPLSAARMSHIESGVAIADAATTNNATAITSHTSVTNPHNDRGISLALTGATQATRYVGGTTTGAPTTGTFVIGDFVIARDGKIWICTVAGSPGTWTSGGAITSVAGRVGAVVLTGADIAAGAPSFTDVAVSGLSGATTASRYVGGTPAAAPTTGTFAVGDVVVSTAGTVGVCTAAGTPGSWTSLPRGLIASKSIVTSVGPTSGLTPLSLFGGLSVPFIAGRNYKVSAGWCGLNSTTTYQRYNVSLTIAAGIVAIRTMDIVEAAIMDGGGSLSHLYVPGSTAAQTVDVTLSRVTVPGSATGTMYGATTAPMLLMVEDMGDTV